MKIAVSAIIIREKRILLIKRGKNQNTEPCVWFFPGGRGEGGETPQEAIVRECKEELNVNFIPQREFQHIEDCGYDVTKFIGKYSGVVCLQEDEIDGYGWFDYNEANVLECAFDMKHILLELKSEGLL